MPSHRRDAASFMNNMGNDQVIWQHGHIHEQFYEHLQLYEQHEQHE